MLPFEPGVIAIVAGVAAVIGCVLVLGGVGALFRGRLLGSAGRTIVGLVLIASGLALGALGLGTVGYRALTNEEVAARVAVRPSGKQRFDAVVTFPDGRVQSYVLAGDELNVEARVLKWKPIGNMLGLKTLYDLDRIGGRYANVEDERRGPRTVHALDAARSIDLFKLRQTFGRLGFLVDAEYGSGTFAAVTEPAELEVRVSPTGLLIRPAAQPARP
jgi:hypothetical protein